MTMTDTPSTEASSKHEDGKVVAIAGPVIDVEFPPDDLPEIIYIDHYGNALSGLRASAMPTTSLLRLGDARIPWARVFSDVPRGSACWYENSIGLVEVAINGGRAATELALKIGDRIEAIAS